MFNTSIRVPFLSAVACLCWVALGGCGSDDTGGGGLASTNPVVKDSGTAADVSLADGGAVDTGAVGAVDSGPLDSGAKPEDSGFSQPDAGGAADAGAVDSGGSTDTGAEDVGIDAGGPADCAKDSDCPPSEVICKVNTCQDDQTCALMPAADGEGCQDGDACTVGDACGDGKCLSGAAAKCDDGNPCTDDSCDKQTGCTTAVNQASCDDGNPCTTGDGCSGGKCAGGAAKDCDDGNPCTDDACNPAAKDKGGCESKINSAACDDGDACTQLDACQFGACKGGKALICNDGNPCTDDACDKGKGCTTAANTAACDDGDACTTKDACKDGKCAGGAAKACDDGNPCTKDSCDSDKGCQQAATTEPCDDGNACTGTKGAPDTCAAGKCGSGALVSCDDNSACTTDFCDAAKGCNNAANTLPCDDGSLCTENDKCAAGKCASGKAKVCNDNNPCTDDSCAPDKGCVILPNKVTCDDNNKCTTGDHCSGGNCIAGEAPKCDDGNPCTTPTCDPGKGCENVPNSHPCSDGDACSLADKCSGGTCAPGQALSCNDGNPCTTDSCDKTAGCVFLANTVTCTDGNACTGTPGAPDQCSNKACAAGKPLNCDDGNACTSDFCNPAKGCDTIANTLPCTDGTVCTAGDSCAGGVCKAGPQLPCNDGNACTDDGCDATKGCQFPANTKPCDDGSACTEKDSCAGGKCTGGPAKNCDDGSPCSIDLCDPAKGCFGLPSTATCTDNDVCTVNDACAGGACKGAPLGCDDGNPCTIDGCDKAKGCGYTAAKDGTACGSGGACKAGKCEIGTTLNPAASCNAVQAANPAAKSGIYTIDPDGKGGNPAFSAYCDLARDGGGWTLAFTSSDDGTATWTWNKRTLLTTNKAPVGDVKAANKDYKSAAHHTLKFHDLLFVHHPSQVWAVYEGVGDGTKSFADVLTGVKAFTCYSHGTGYKMTAGNLDLAPSGKFCETRLYIHPADRDGNPSKCGDNDAAFGPAWSVSSNNPCPMDDPGSASGLGPKQDGGNTEYNARGFGAVLGLNTGKAGAAQNYVQVFVRQKIPPACGNGKLETGEACDDGNKLGGDGCSGTCTIETVASCAALGVANPQAKSGVYSVDPDGSGPIAAYQTHCDMERDKGGWTLAYTSSDDGAHTWTWNNRKLWENTAVVGAASAWHRDFKSAAAFTHKFNDVLMVHAPSGVWASYHGVGNGSGTIGQHIANVGGPICYLPAQGHAMTAGTLKVGGKLCDTKLYFNADDRDGNKTKCGDDEKAWGPVFNARDNQACPWDDPGLSGTCGPNLSNPGQERHVRGFGRVLGLNTGAGGTGANHIRIYVR